MRNHKKVTEKDSDYSYHEMDSACIGFINKNVVNTHRCALIVVWMMDAYTEYMYIPVNKFMINYE